MLLSNLFYNIRFSKTYNFKKDINIKFITSNSKLIKKNSLYVVNFNRKIKQKYIYDAKKKGAVAIISNKFIKNTLIPQFIVKELDKNLNKILYNFKNMPPKNIIGVTGTNGKTSVVWIISNIIKLCGKNVRTVGTLGIFDNLKKISDSNLTTPEYETLHQLAYSNKNKNNNEFVFEVSSHSISKKRIKNFPINIASITNITQDHLDFHKSLKNYKNTKFKLFNLHLLKNGTAVLNDKIKGMINLKKKLIKKNIKIITYGKKNSDINCFFYNEKKIKIKIYKKNFLVRFNLVSRFELENLSCAIGSCIAIGINQKKIMKVLNKIEKAEGRMQFVDKLNNESKIYVDYAHTPDALKNVLKYNLFKKKPDLIFGCGGNRDKSKRKIMGSIANKLANKVYITDDNPRNENPAKIRKEIISTCPKAQEINNRKNAIRIAIENLNKQSVLIIAGKGHEKKQIFNKEVIKFDDYKIAKSIIKKINNETK